MPTAHSNPQKQEAIQELSLGDLLLRVAGFYSELRRHWRVVTFCLLLSTGTMIGIAYLTPPKFPAQLTFMVREDSQNGLGGVASLLGQFGFAGGGGGEYNLDKITELAKSRHILQYAIFDSATIGGKNDLLANHVIVIHDLHNEWKKDTLLHSFLFKHGDVKRFGPLENKALKALHQYMVADVDKAFVATGYSKQTSILNLTVSARNEALSIALVEALYQHLGAFYIEQSTAQSRQTVRNLEARTDSIRAILTASETSLARTEDRTLGLLLKEDRVPQKRLGTDVQILNLMYAEAIKNLETASFLLKNTTPVFMEIDRPLAPIKPVRASKKTAAAIGLAVGFLLAVIWIYGRKIYQKLRSGLPDTP